MKEYGIHPVVLLGLDDGMININHRIKSEEGDFVFKRYTLRNPQQVAYEIAVLDRLAKHGFSCPRVRKTLAGKSQTVWQGKPTILLDFIPGKPLKRWNAEILHQVGRMLGQMHMATEGMKLPSVDRERWSFPEVAWIMKNGVKRILALRDGIRVDDIYFMSAEYATLGDLERLPTGVTHQDVKPDNIVMGNDGTISFIDFDNVYDDALLIDLATTIIWTCFPGGELVKGSLSSLLAGYESVKPLTKIEKRLFYDLIRFRLLREALDWPMRFSTEQALKNHRHFLAAYRDLAKSRKSIEKIWKA
ncbi:MAG: phosphotransferase [Patescibacteria group bacterium]|nr:phosphotransferase [Patescibacteria group bacterium]